MDSSSAAWGRVVVATAVALVAGIVAAGATVAGTLVARTASAGRDDAGVGGFDGESRGSPPADPTTGQPAPAGAPSEVIGTAPPSTDPPSPTVSSRAAGTAPGDASSLRLRTRPSAASAPADPGVRRPPPRPNRASEAPDQQAPPAAASAPTTPASTARYAQDFPDPFVYRSGPYWYAVSTQRGWSKVPLIRSLDLVRWEEQGDALAALPRWSRFGALWAPAVLAVDGAFVLYYSTTEDATGLQCLSVGFAVRAEGPFVDASAEPLVCQRDRGGSIDPSPFRDVEGRPWLAWKSEGTTDGEPTRLWSQPLSSDGRRLAAGSAPRELLVTGLPWEKPIIEAPSMFIGPDGAYHLLYSGNRWETSSYASGHARCAGPAGPCVRSSEGPVTAGHPSEAGAGGAEAFFDGSGWRVAYHAWDPSAVGYPGGMRRLRIGEVRLGEDGSLRVEPSTG